MAAKKEAETVQTRPEELQEAAQQEKPASPWDEEVTIHVPRKPQGEDQQYYICINDRRYMVPADGKMQKLPRPVAEVLLASLDAERKAEELADDIQKDSNKV